MLNIDRAWQAAVGFLPICATIATLAPIAGAAHLGTGIVILGAAVAMSSRHRGGRRGWSGLVRVPVAVAGTSVLALVFRQSLVAGDVLFVALVLAARLSARYGPRAYGVGRAVMLPLTALFIAPPVPLGQHRLAMFGWIALACLVASVWSVAVPALLPPPGPDPAPVVRAARACVAAAASGRPVDRRVRALGAAGLALDAKLSTEDEAARRAVCELEHAVDRVVAGTAEPTDVETAVERLRAAVAGRPAAVPAERERTGSPAAYTKLAAQSAAALSLAFLVGQVVFPDHWPWTVITVITVSFAARSRGEVVVKTGQRLVGALAATAVVTPLAPLVGRHRPLAFALLLAILAAGMYLRERSYVWWPAAITSILSLLYALTGQVGGAEMLRERLLAILAGGACAIAPAVLLAPIRTRDLVRKRTAACLHAIRDCLEAHRSPEGAGVAAVRRVDAALADLHAAARPLVLTRRVRDTREVAWVTTLATCTPPLRALATGAGGRPDPGIGAALTSVGAELRDAVAARSRAVG